MNTLRATPQEIFDAVRLACPAWAPEIHARLAAHLLDAGEDGVTEGRDNVSDRPTAPGDDPMAHQNYAPESDEDTGDGWTPEHTGDHPPDFVDCLLTVEDPDGIRLVMEGCWTHSEWVSHHRDKVETGYWRVVAWRHHPTPWMGEEQKKGDAA